MGLQLHRLQGYLQVHSSSRFWVKGCVLSVRIVKVSYSLKVAYYLCALSRFYSLKVAYYLCVLSRFYSLKVAYYLCVLSRFWFKGCVLFAHCQGSGLKVAYYLCALSRFWFKGCALSVCIVKVLV